MARDFTADWFPEGMDPAAYDPARSARAAMKRKLPKRFYARAEARETPEGFLLELDGRPALTRARHRMVLPNAAGAALLVAEWAAQNELIDPASMPVTRIVHAALDHVAGAADAVRDDILKYAGSDLVCYRAGNPEELVALQAQHWDPVIRHVEKRHGARFVQAEGIRFVEQPAASLAALRASLAGLSHPLALAALHVLTSISGSALIAIAIRDGALDAEAGFLAGEVDADYEVSVWGGDEEASAARASRHRDFLAAAALLHALQRG